MIKQEKLNKVTEAIHKACPDLLELRKGCKILYYDEDTGQKEWDVRDEYQYNNRVINLISESLVKTLWKDDDFKILGQPIGICSILRAIKKLDKTLIIDGIETHSKQISIDVDGLFIGCYETSLDASWNLEKDTLDQQEETVIDLLHSILCHDNN